MAENSRGGLFRTRNILGAALVAGIGLGVYLGQFKGFGLGGSNSIGIGSPTSEPEATIEPAMDSPIVKHTNEPVPNVIKILIDDHEFLLKDADEAGKRVPIKLAKLIELVKQAPGDADGFRIKIYEKSTARMSAEESLKDALVAAEIPNTAILWVPGSVK